ncbi:MAG: carbon-nitrogen hydrolase family protein [Chloroflexi bacterium]|nr:carbon-nitrogen hydrolase family protein [Chloroflexota bacterium]
MRTLLASINCQKAEIDVNIAAHRAVILEARSLRSDLVVFPEMSLTGYLSPAVHGDHFLDLDSSYISELIEFGSANSVDLLFGIVERNPTGQPFITQVHALNGSIAGVYRKRHLAEDETLFSPGAHSYQGSVAGSFFGVAVCADRSVADEFVAASESGARVLFHPSAPGLYGPRRFDDASWKRGFDWWRESCIELHSQRAVQYGVSIAVCTQAGATIDEDFPGWAALFGPDGKIVVELPDWNEGTLLIEV